MRLKVYYYGIFSKIVGKQSEIIEFDGKNLYQLKDFLLKMYPGMADKSPIISVNFRTLNDIELKDNDEIIVMAIGPGG
ncbi:MAG: MoaD/ThiS family protein [Thermoplasmata archaeon]